MAMQWNKHISTQKNKKPEDAEQGTAETKMKFKSMLALRMSYILFFSNGYAFCFSDIA